jgi:hypothetical protein
LSIHWLRALVALGLQPSHLPAWHSLQQLARERIPRSSDRRNFPHGAVQVTVTPSPDGAHSQPIPTEMLLQVGRAEVSDTLTQA